MPSETVRAAVAHVQAALEAREAREARGVATYGRALNEQPDAAYYWPTELLPALLYLTRETRRLETELAKTIASHQQANTELEAALDVLAAIAAATPAEGAEAAEGASTMSGPGNCDGCERLITLARAYLEQ